MEAQSRETIWLGQMFKLFLHLRLETLGIEEVTMTKHARETCATGLIPKPELRNRNWKLAV